MTDIQHYAEKITLAQGVLLYSIESIVYGSRQMDSILYTIYIVDIVHCPGCDVYRFAHVAQVIYLLAEDSQNTSSVFVSTIQKKSRTTKN